MPDLVQLAIHDDIAVITIDNPPVNALGPGVPEGIDRAVRTSVADAKIRAIVMIGAGHTFIAGADIREFGKIVSGAAAALNLLNLSLQVIEDSPKPVWWPFTERFRRRAGNCHVRPLPGDCSRCASRAARSQARA